MIELVEISLTEIRDEWEAIQGDKLDFLSWLEWNGISITGERIEWKPK
jgi:hypothetical protein